MSFRTIVADPPWPNTLGGIWQRQHSTPEAHYKTLSLREIRRFDVASVAADNAYLWLWVPTFLLIRGAGVRVAKAWGFRSITTLEWVKPQIGIGYYLRNAHESCLLCVRGSPGQLLRRDVPTWHVWPRRRHSEKPGEFFALVEHLCSGPYLELFARRRRDGWSAFGNEVESDVLLSPLQT